MSDPTRAVLLVNLGSPDSPSVPDVRRYLREFLTDGRVIDSPWIIRQLVVNALILPARPKESAKAYASIWTAEGSPLVVTSKRVQVLLQERLPVPVELAMRYGKPSIPRVVDDMAKRGIEDIFLIPLYPHYAMSSYETVVERVREVIARRAYSIRLSVLPPFYEEQGYIDALVGVARPYLEKSFDRLLFSYHGIPERHLRKSDPTGSHCLAAADCCESASAAHAVCYRAQTRRTTRAFVERAGLRDEQWSISYQSRLGSDPWLKPYTDEELKRFPQDGVRRLLVICPAFVSDCLETLEEIAERGRHEFMDAGGESYEMIPCLNDDPRWISVLESYCTRQMAGQAPLAGTG
jgi:ferrochelatase